MHFGAVGCIPEVVPKVYTYQFQKSMIRELRKGPDDLSTSGVGFVLGLYR